MTKNVFADYVAARRARTGRKFETVERMKPAFADLDAAGWNDWPPRSDDELIRIANEARKEKP